MSVRGETSQSNSPFGSCQASRQCRRPAGQAPAAGIQWKPGQPCGIYADSLAHQSLSFKEH